MTLQERRAELSYARTAMTDEVECTWVPCERDD